MALLNFRDAAGHGAAGDGSAAALGSSAGLADTGPLQPGRLFRSAQPYELSDSDVELVLSHGIRTVIDLREPAEAVPPDWELVERRGVTIARLPLSEQVMAASDDLAPLMRRPQDAHRFLGEFYVAVTRHTGATLAKAFEVIADGAPVLVHCAAGKDRTGTLVALVLELVGVDDDAIVADYLLTNRAREEFVRQLSAGVPEAERIDLAAMPPSLSDAPESAIRRLLDHVREQGGTRNLLREFTSDDTFDRVVRALT